MKIVQVSLSYRTYLKTFLSVLNYAPAALHGRHCRRLWLRDRLTRLPRRNLRGADDRQQGRIR